MNVWTVEKGSIHNMIKIKYRNDDTRRLTQEKWGDWIDLATDEDVTIPAGEYKLIDFGIVMEIPDGYEVHIIPRSSTYAKHGIIQANSYGLIDNSYRGENDWWGFPAISLRDTFIPRGTRIAQFRFVKNMDFEPLFFEPVDWPHKDNRGGFGSTGN